MTKKSLIIVESPAKIKTLKKFLGKNYHFASSVGHIRDLPKNEFGIDVENDFEPKYEPLPDKSDVIKNLKKAAKESDIVYLSPDPDREGEAIAWHISQLLPKDTVTKRVTFNAITKDEVQKGLQNPREIDYALVNAQQARRLLDRIVGYKISPILNRRLQRGRSGSVSAGRVQSVALKLIVDREKEIEAFKPVEFWKISAALEEENTHKSFIANLHKAFGKKVEKEQVPGKDVFTISNKKQADEIVSLLKKAEFIVSKVDKKEKKRNPVPPFITSTLQQEASRHYGYSATRTMKIAQTLYEGIDMGSEGVEGLITYMRTDSVRVTPTAIEEVRKYIKNRYGETFLPQKPNLYTTKKAAQDAHEAIRPTNLNHPPEKIKPFLTDEQFKLYLLIWQRFIASQMKPAIYDTVSADIKALDFILRASGSVIKFKGFLAVYHEMKDDDEKEDEIIQIPDLTVGQKLHLLEIKSEQSFTKPPPRYTEASLVKELEKLGVGRPSTYAPIMRKIHSRDYTVREGNRLKPTELGQVIVQMLEANFSEIMDIDFTARMEDSLEEIAAGKTEWKQLLRNFWKDFNKTVETAEKEAFVPKVMTEHKCPKCGANLQKVWYRSNYFLGCSNYPECNYSIPIAEMEFSKDDYAKDFDWEQKCPLCQGEMKVRHGKFGAFLGCINYPECKGIINIPKKGESFISHEDMPNCPAIGCEGKMVARKSRFGKTFYSCSEFPNCDVIVNDLSQLESKYPNHPKTAYVKKARKGKTKKASAKTKKTRKKATNLKPASLSSELADIVGTKELPRSQVMGKVWEYIKANKLQDPNDGRVIIPDDKLAKVFGSKEPIQMFKMTKLISSHIGKTKSIS